MSKSNGTLRRLTAVIITLMMLFSLIPATAFADDKTYDDIRCLGAADNLVDLVRDARLTYLVIVEVELAVVGRASCRERV